MSEPRRTALVPLRRTLVTPDLAEALRQVEMRTAAVQGARLVFQGPTSDRISWDGVRADPGPSGCPPHASMRATGREVHLRLQLPPGQGDAASRRQAEVEVLWGLAVPCGFTPWNRYPLAGPGDDLFHFFGPWQVLYDALLGEGLGEVAWPSTCAAAQLDVGKWEGDRVVERFVQAQLHRLGFPCGPVDGIMTDRVQQAVRAVGMRGMRLDDVARRLASMTLPEAPAEARRHGFVSFGGQATAVAAGKVSVMRTPQGFALTVDGPGRVILDLGG